MPREIRHPEYGHVELAYTLDDLIAHLEWLRREHGGDVLVACEKDSSNTAHLLDGIGEYSTADEAWDPDDRHRGPVIVLGIND